ncbi:hypothetical protein CSW30_03125 [Thermus scotoductus]|uniref:Helix-turn-helix domain-containing protein n=1 Tax=Thermus scotoductus TaxID=37636 RepID=A0A430URP9_THESC|nr:hypothetical protein CSW30_03125 [Thermus scotoductus]
MYRLNHTVWRLNISATEKLVLSYLLDRADRLGTCWPSLKTIASATSMTVRGVSKVLGRLRERGLVSWSSRDNGVNLYRIDLGRLAQLAEARSGNPGDMEPSSNGMEPGSIPMEPRSRGYGTTFHRDWNVVPGGMEPRSTEPFIELPIEPPNNNPPLPPPPNLSPIHITQPTKLMTTSHTVFYFEVKKKKHKPTTDFAIYFHFNIE